MVNRNNGYNYRVIIVLNEKYFPSTCNFTAKVGASSFSLKVLNCLYKNNKYGGIILYKRDESLVYPVIEEKYIENRSIITLRFNFKMKEHLIKDALEDVILGLVLKASQFTLPIVYYQTDTLLKYHPKYVPGCVTHHGPFVDDFINHYSAFESYKAFETKEKALHLSKQQKKGLESLIQEKNIYVLQHSVLQKNYITEKGFDNKNIFKISPPISMSSVKSITLRDNISQFIMIKKGEMLLISTAARIDYFKNFDSLIKESVKVLKRGIPLKILIAGDSKEKEVNRIKLRSLIPDYLKKHFLLTESLPQNELYSLFKLSRNKATFVCTSRYETLGITPLEAALAGVYTIIPDSRLVEASLYFSNQDKFNHVPDQLESFLVGIYENKRYINNPQSFHMGKLISYEKFEKSLLGSLYQIFYKHSNNPQLVNNSD